MRSLPDSMQSEGILACWPEQPKPGQRSLDSRSLGPLLVFPFAPWRAGVPSTEWHQHRKALLGSAHGRREIAMVRRRTGLLEQDVRDDFDRARRRANWAKMAGGLLGRPASRNRLAVLGEVTSAPGAGGPGRRP